MALSDFFSPKAIAGAALGAFMVAMPGDAEARRNHHRHHGWGGHHGHYHAYRAPPSVYHVPRPYYRPPPPVYYAPRPYFRPPVCGWYQAWNGVYYGCQ